MRIRILARILREFVRGDDTPGKRLETLDRIGQQLVPGYRFSWPHPDWWQAERFNAYLREVDELTGFNTHRRWMLGQLLRMIASVPGDTAECGVYRGSTSRLICQSNAASKLDRHHFMFDSFEGVSPPTSSDGEYWSAGDLSTTRQAAETALADYDAKTFLDGWIPTRFAEVADRGFSFVHLDVDLHDPTRDSIEFFYQRLNPGGILLCDDYGSEFCPGATKACDDFLRDRPEQIISLAVGGGFLIKGVETSPDLYSRSR